MNSRFLIVRLSSMGDVILTTALVRCLRKAHPESKIDFLVKKQFAEILKDNPYINDLYLLDTQANKQEQAQLFDKLSKNEYTHYIDLQKNIRSFKLKKLLKAKNNTTFSKQVFKRFFLINFKINLYKNLKPVFIRYFEAARKYNLRYDNLGTDIFISENNKAIVNNWLSEKNIDVSNCFVIAPGAYWKNKCWPKEKYIELAKKLLEDKYKTLLLLGGKNEFELCKSMADEIKGNVFNAAGVFSIQQTSFLVSKSKIVITNDTGLLHISQAVKIPVVAIFGPTTEQLGFFPFGNKNRVAQVNLPCRPCTQMGKNYCPKKHFKCMNNISVKDVEILVSELNN